MNAEYSSKFPLHEACRRGQLELVKQSIQNPNYDNGRDLNQRKPIHLASENGHHEIVELLLKDGKAENHFIYDECLQWASFNGHHEVVQVLIKSGKANVNGIHFPTKLTPLQLASSNGHEKVVEILLSIENVNVNAKAKGGLTALHFASELGHPNVVNLLLKSGKADVNMKSDLIRTPLTRCSSPQS